MTDITKEELLIKPLILILFSVCTSIISFEAWSLKMEIYAVLIHYLRIF